MQSGTLYLCDSLSTGLDDFRATVALPQQAPVDSVSEGIDIRDSKKTEDGVLIQSGDAAAEELIEDEVTQITDSRISNRTKETINANFGTFTYSSDGILIVGGGSSFIPQIISEHTEINAQSSKIDINSYFDFLRSVHGPDDVEVWKVGFEEKRTNADNGVLHGSDLMNDSELKPLLESSEKTQLGVEFQFRGERINLYVAESGYFDIYEPTNYPDKQVVEFLQDQLTQFATTE
ncbi:hypothetical protein JZX76_15590 [Haloarcula hispanica]|uniref:Uncharacterized protein n=1 Tax=Haloarcula hispanica TaxID=51589 RepID=A0A482T6P8_HALHI|nr:hypothetical protein [Haloarcula hispanica]MCJ0620879.1 hypothetical protein [Haloarcula hispanica]RYJ11236.1 hypothetical protein ELS20_15440 [Haloarcula hispanica]